MVRFSKPLGGFDSWATSARTGRKYLRVSARHGRSRCVRTGGAAERHRLVAAPGAGHPTRRPTAIRSDVAACSPDSAGGKSRLPDDPHPPQGLLDGPSSVTERRPIGPALGTSGQLNKPGPLTERRGRRRSVSPPGLLRDSWPNIPGAGPKGGRSESKLGPFSVLGGVRVGNVGPHKVQCPSFAR